MQSYETTLYPKYSIQSCGGTKNNEGDKFLSDRVGNTGAYYVYIYPNFMINRYGEVMDTNLVTPIGSDKCRVQFDFFFKPDATPAFIEKSIKISEEIQLEDHYVSEMVQQGVSSNLGYDVGRYAPRIETAAYHFHQLLFNNLSAS